MKRRDQPWYANGLRFACTECGHCCTGPEGYVWVDEAEIEAIADRLDLDVDTFGRRYLRRIGTKYSLLEDPVTKDCVFLKEKRCTIYDVRPRQCAAFPWWPENVNSNRAWQQTARDCEGIHGEAPIVPLATIQAAIEKLDDTK